MGVTPKISSFFKRKVSSISDDHELVVNALPKPLKNPCQDVPNSSLDVSNSFRVTKSQKVDKNEDEIIMSLLERDPGLRKQICDYYVNKRDEVRRAYIITHGPYQPKWKKDEYPFTSSGSAKGARKRRFQAAWFKTFEWLEYSPSKNKAFCFACFLFGTPSGSSYGGQISFVETGFDNWKKVTGKECSFRSHEGIKCDSSHQAAVSMWNQIRDPSPSNASLQQVVQKFTSEQIANNRLRLKTSIDLVRKLSFQAVAFRGHDESISSMNQGNFLEFHELLKSYNEDVKKAMANAPGNATYTLPLIQKEILEIFSTEVKKLIRDEIGDAKFCIIVDEARDESKKEQMAIVIRFVTKDGFIRERFFGVTHVRDTVALTLKEGIYSALPSHDLNIQNIRGQGFDGASNMRGEFNGLQALIAKDCRSAYYVHCFAHRLQLALVASAKDYVYLERFFTKLTLVVNTVTSSCKRSDELKAAQASDIEYLLSINELQTGKGKNQVGTIPRPGDTRWSSHLRSVSGLLNMYSAACSVLLNVVEVGQGSKKGEAFSAHEALISFEFVFILHLMKSMLGITDILCQSLQCKTQDILNAMEMVVTTKVLLQELRETKFDYLLGQVKSFCEARNIDIPNLDAQYVSRYKKVRDKFSVRDRYRIDIFYTAIDSQLQELNHRFSDHTIKLLSLSSTLSPNSSSTFNIDDICELVEKFYSEDFTRDEKEHLKVELKFYEHRVVKNVEYMGLKTMSALCQWLVRKNMSTTFQLVYKVIVLVLTLPISTASAERSFSAMKLIKSCLRNKMEDGFLTDSMMLYVEKELASTITTDSIIDIFAKKGSRRVPFS